MLKYPLTGYQFAIEIGGVLHGGFSECSQFAVQWQVEKVKEGGVNHYEHQLPTRIKAAKLTLKHGANITPDLWRWLTQGMYDGHVEYLNMSIVMFETGWVEVKRWNLERAYPIEWKGPSLKADSKNVAIESLTIAFHGMDLEQGF